VRDAHGSVTLKSSFGAIEAFERPEGDSRHHGEREHHAHDIGGDTFAKTSFGSVSTERINGNLTVENSNGSVTAKNVKGDAGVKTSFAGVTLESIGGRITVDNQNGAISVTAMRSGQRLPRHFAQDIVLLHPRARSRGLGLQPHGKDFFRRISSELRSLQRRYRGRYTERHHRLGRLPASTH